MGMMVKIDLVFTPSLSHKLALKIDLVFTPGLSDKLVVKNDLEYVYNRPQILAHQSPPTHLSLSLSLPSPT